MQVQTIINDENTEAAEKNQITDTGIKSQEATMMNAIYVAIHHNIIKPKVKQPLSNNY